MIVVDICGVLNIVQPPSERRPHAIYDKNRRAALPEKVKLSFPQPTEEVKYLPPLPTPLNSLEKSYLTCHVTEDI